MLSMLEFFQKKTGISERCFSALFHQIEAKGLFFYYPIDGACKLTRTLEPCCSSKGKATALEFIRKGGGNFRKDTHEAEQG